MKITKFSICGFRNLGKTSIELKPITALVSLNSYGKSNLFSALDFALSFMHSTTNVRKDMMSSISSMPLNANLDTTDFSFSIEIDYDNNGNERSASYRFSFEWARNNGNGAKLVAEELSIRDKKARSHTKLLMQRFEGNAKLRFFETGRCSSNIKKEFGDSELVLDYLKVSCPDYMKIVVNAVSNIKAYIDEQLDATSLYHCIPQIVFHSDIGRDLTLENIPNSLFMLKQKDPILYSNIENIFLSLFPNIANIEILESDISKDLKVLTENGNAPFSVSPKIYSLWVRDRNMNQPLDFRFLSAGAKRVLMQLVHIANARMNGISIVGLEEPENSIHPALFQGFLDTLENLAGDMRIIITSHSPYLIEYLDFGGIYIGLPSDDGIARFRTFASSRKLQELMSDADESSTLIGNYIFELLSGNESERKILSSYLEAVDES